MYLTKITLDLRNHRVYKDLTDLRCYHGYLENAFSAEIMLGVRKRHLWRLDKGGSILLLSEDKPDRIKLMNFAKKVKTIDYDLYLSGLNSDRTYHFELVANPTKKNIKTKQRIPLLTVPEQKQWLQKKAENNGFRILNCDIQRTTSNLIHYKEYKISSVNYTGVLQITNLPVFKSALTKGLGQSKAYGQGLLTII